MDIKCLFFFFFSSVKLRYFIKTVITTWSHWWYVQALSKILSSLKCNTFNLFIRTLAWFWFYRFAGWELGEACKDFFFLLQQNEELVLFLRTNAMIIFLKYLWGFYVSENSIFHYLLMNSQSNRTDKYLSNKILRRQYIVNLNICMYLAVILFLANWNHSCCYCS